MNGNHVAIALIKIKVGTGILQEHIDERRHFIIKVCTRVCDLCNSFYAKILSNKGFLYIIATVYSFLYAVYNSSLSVFLSAKHHHNCNFNTKTHLFISGTKLIQVSF